MLLYYLIGRFTLWLTWPENNLMAVWPPAGVALGAVLLWGNQILPAIYVADLLLHLTKPNFEVLFLENYSLFLLPLMAVFKAWLGAFLARKFAGFPNHLIFYRAILWFFFMAGMVAAFLPDLLHTLILVANSTLHDRYIIYYLFSLWLSDCSGIAIFTPIFFCLFDDADKIWRQRLISLGIPVLAMFLAVAIGYRYSQGKELLRLHRIMASQALAVKTALESAYRNHLGQLNRFQQLAQLQLLNQANFRLYAPADFHQQPELLRLDWLKPDSNVAGKWATIETSINPANSSVGLIDIPNLLQGQLVGRHPTVLIVGSRYVIILPVIGSACNCVQDLISGVFDLQAALRRLVQVGNFGYIDVKLSGFANTQEVITLLGNPDMESGDPLQLGSHETVSLGKQTSQLWVLPNKSFLAEHYSWSPWQFFIGGMFLNGFLSLGLLLLTGHTRLVAAQVERRTQELRRSNRKLAARERQFRKLVQTQSAIVWRADPITFRFIFVSAEAASILGYPIRQWLEEPDFWVKRLHVEDRDRVVKMSNDIQAQAKNASYEQEYRMIAADGHIVWLRDIVTLVVESGVVTDLYGFMIDITRQKQSEEQLRLAANTFESQQGIIITDKNANILRVNQAFTKMTGYSAQQVIGLNPRFLKSGRHDQLFFQNYWGKLLTEGKFEGEIWNRRKNGEIYPEWQTVTAVYNDKGEITHFVSVSSDISERKDAEDKIHSMAFYDALTNLPNRRLLLDRFDQELAIARRHKHYGALLYLDLDHFKMLNDNQGHLAGDELLVQVAERLIAVLREEDTPARLGGDEFVVLLHANGDSLEAVAEHAMIVAEKIREQLNTPFMLTSCRYQIGTSIGIALFPEPHEEDGEVTVVESPESILQQADTAMYRSKSSGRNSINFFQPSMQEAANLRLSFEYDLRSAIDQGRFILCYHPQVDSDGQLVGAEALIRWEDKTKGRLSPADFIPVAEESNLILGISKWVLMEACSQIREWQDAGLKSPLVTLNISAKQFRQSDFVQQVYEALFNNGVNPSHLGIELTESVMIIDIQDTLEKLKALKRLGISITVDNFGTGYSSLMHLKKLPLDALKIYRGFIRDIFKDDNQASIVEAIISMTEHLNVQVIAEGVETMEQLNYLKSKGCHNFQGYYFSHPLTAANFAEIYLKKGSRKR